MREIKQVLIATVGHSRAPVEFSLAEHAPDGVVFIASQDSQVVAAELVREYGANLRHHTFLLDDPESLTESYRVAQQALRKALEWEARSVVADVTGGTKPMVAGVVLALSGRGVTFSYVGGEQRDEAGRVVGGAERLKLLEDPTTRYGVREWGEFVQAWNIGQMDAAGAHLEALLQRELSPSERRFYRHLKGVVEGLVAWDRFQHAAAQKLLREHLEPALAVAEAWGHGGKVRVLQGLKQGLERLQELLNRGNAPSFELLADLLANAERRAAAGRYDDALARLYRALELAAEADVYARHGVVLRRPETYPEALVNLKDRASGLRGLKETLALAFDLDVRGGYTGTLAQRLYGDYAQRLQGLLDRRHQSILAHGIKPVAVEDYRALRDYLVECGLEAAPAWPKW
ncbi:MULTISPECIES: TIGR02710 family CRISPR-associated CARF protein [unclassified Meiothermus]|uniref:TIGR02710 family CRISPR-associated CARF protein n=1 Tax=unclassified Meiothermus TaxID=370471 RepID=UPI000D7C1AEA|nr:MULTISPECIES: TIGR02710 family CRISPR-associated CARF protein [unclassified Meiothermus]PZA07273.1 TIGR02710 family CRISPR-associated protein [Meiothermus sp. Pnk-1]RYM38007.1 TIGR02710 family CRISPR-associated protein [Meiothermus sp. PNK-Is4]